MKIRLDNLLHKRGITTSRSQAESHIKLGLVNVNGNIVKKPGTLVDESDEVKLTAQNRYVSRAAIKLESVVDVLSLDFTDNVVLDVGSSTGGFTDYVLQHGASRVLAVDVGKNQLHPTLRGDLRIELHEQTDIRDLDKLNTKIDKVLIDVSFISLKQIIPAVKLHIDKNTLVVAMVKPQFESNVAQKNKGVIKNNSIRRGILKDFENWIQGDFRILSKADSKIKGEKGNLERFYCLKLLDK